MNDVNIRGTACLQDIVPNACGEAMESAAAALPLFLDAVLLLKVSHNLPAFMQHTQYITKL